MNDDVKMFIGYSFGVIVLGWVLVRSADVDTVTKSLASGYTSAVQALRPPSN